MVSTVPAPSPADAAAPVLRMRGIVKRFGALVANNDISLELARGEVLALLGENGAGKSTLMAILFGHYRADAGSVEVEGRALPPGQPRAALDSGVGMVHQHFTLAENLSVLDNVMLGTEPLARLRSRRAEARAALLAAAQRFGLSVKPEALVRSLSVGERQRVEILKALVRGARILILDEPTAVLTPQESESLFATLAQMVAQGLSIVFISHKLDEVLRVSHRIAVLRGGRLVGEFAAAATSREQLANAMVGHAVEMPQRRGGRGAAGGAPVVELRGVTVLASGAARPLLERADLAIQPGEIVAVAGVSGNGQAALTELLHGLRAADAGQLRLAGQPMPAQPRDWIEAGCARIPEDRLHSGIVGDLALWENAVLERYHARPLSRWGWLNRRAARAQAEALVRRGDIRGTEGTGLDTVTRSLSGGNVQKLILGRAMRLAEPGAPAPRLIVAAQPTWGLDVGAVAAVHQRLLDACDAGAAVLLVSDDLDEILALADRIAVIYQGRLTAARPKARWTREAIGLAMAGAAPKGGDDGGDAGADAATASAAATESTPHAA